MDLTHIAAIVLRQFYLIRGSLSRVLPLFVWAGIDIVLWGFITKYLNTVTPPGLNLVPSLLGAVLLWDFLIRVMQGVTTAFFEDVWSRNFLNIFATPLTIGEYLSGLVITGVITSLFGLAAMILLATMPVWMQAIGHGLAPSYVFEAMRSIVAGDGVVVSALILGAALAIAYV